MQGDHVIGPSRLLPQTSGAVLGKLFFVQGHLVNISDFAGHVVSDRITQCCYCIRKAAVDDL